MDKKFFVFWGIFLVSILIWLYTPPPSPFDEIENQRDYLVARHIVIYNEFPLVGPRHSLYGTVLTHSPAYYYYLALFVAIWDSESFLRIINSVLQLSAGILLYLLAKRLFGSITALVAFTLFILSEEIFRFSITPIHPGSLHPFVILAFFLLVVAYDRNRYFFLLLGIVSIFFASALYSAGLLLVPFFFFTAFLILKNKKRDARYYGGACIVALASFLIFYAPILINIYVSGDTPYNLIAKQNLYVSSFSEWIMNIFQNGRMFKQLFFIDSKAHFISSFSFSDMVSGIVVILFVLYFYFQRELRKIYGVLLIVGGIASYFLALSLVSAPIYHYHFLPIMGLFILVIAEIIIGIFPRHVVFIPAQLILVTFFIFVFSGTMFSVHESYYDKLQPLVVGIKKEVLRLDKEMNYTNFRFFQIRFYRSRDFFRDPQTDSAWLPFVDAIFWSPLEKYFGDKFTAVMTYESNLESKYLYYIYRYFNYTQTNNDDFIFVICQYKSYWNERDTQCLETFFQESPRYELIKKIYFDYSFSIYLTKRNNQMDLE